MLNLVEDESTISKHFTSYLTKTKVSDWKYEVAIKQLLDLGFLPTDENDLQKLGSIYKHIATKLKNENSVTHSEAEHKKIASVVENMEFLCKASPIKKIVREKKLQYAYRQTLEGEDLDADTVEEDSWETKKKTAEKNFDNLSVNNKFAHLRHILWRRWSIKPSTCKTS